VMAVYAAAACATPVALALIAFASRLVLLRFIASQLHQCPPEMRHDICARLVAPSAIHDVKPGSIVSGEDPEAC
jgi:hypothetical protein